MQPVLASGEPVRSRVQPGSTRLCQMQPVATQGVATRKMHDQLPVSQAPRLSGSADADWAGESDTAKSTTGWAFSAGSGSLSWRAGTQNIVAHSSTEAELIALDEACRELMYLRALFADMRIPVELPVRIAQDNQSTIKLVDAGRFNPRTRHMNVRYHYCHGLQSDGLVLIHHLGTDKMPSDVLTKALSKREHRKHSDVLLGRAQLEGAC